MKKSLLLLENFSKRVKVVVGCVTILLKNETSPEDISYFHQYTNSLLTLV